MIMKQFLRNTMKTVAAYVELFLSAVLVFVIVVLIIKLIGQCFFDIWHDKIKLEYYMEYIMSLAIGVEFVKMLCTHKPGTIIEVLLFATARQMIVEHLNVYETLVGIGAIAALFAIRKFLFCSFDEADHMICRGSQTVARANFVERFILSLLDQIAMGPIWERGVPQVCQDEACFVSNCRKQRS